MRKAKSAAQIRRMEKRAAARGETFVYKAQEVPEEKAEGNNKAKEGGTKTAEEKSKILTIGKKLKTELKEIEENAALKSKDRRALKRKAEAIAIEEVGDDIGMTAAEVLEYYDANGKETDTAEEDGDDNSKTAVLRKAAEKLQSALNDLESNEELKAKDRRSAKRKAEAIALEESGMLSTEELLDWYLKNGKSKNKKTCTKDDSRKHDPYIAFVGQLSYDTTKDELFEHIKDQLKDEYKIVKSTLTIRMLTDAKTKKSRGMAFVEVHDDPQVLYALLKLHQTYLKGRRINTERSAGGKKNNTQRKSKILQFRQQQKQYFDEVVDNILQEYRKTGELREDELDDGVIALCKRHSGPVVKAAVTKYIEGSGRDMDNPSAYLTFLLTKFAEEGLYEDTNDGKNKHNEGPKKKRPKRAGGDDSNYSTKDRVGNNKSSSSSSSDQFKSSSRFSKSGIDMSISENKSAAAGGNLSKIFPSSGRGRGRGYM